MDSFWEALRFGDDTLEVIGKRTFGGEKTRFGRSQAKVRGEACCLRYWQFGQLSPNRIDPRIRKLQRGQVGFGEVAIVVRLFLAALRNGYAAHIVPAESFLHNGSVA